MRRSYIWTRFRAAGERWPSKPDLRERAAVTVPTAMPTGADAPMKTRTVCLSNPLARASIAVSARKEPKIGASSEHACLP
jgi:hypothetical protein